MFEVFGAAAGVSGVAMPPTLGGALVAAQETAARALPDCNRRGMRSVRPPARCAKAVSYRQTLAAVARFSDSARP